MTTDSVGRSIHTSLTLLERLGSGGMGVVFLAEHEAMRRRVALKVLTGRLQDDPESTRRFVQEIRTSAKLAHPRFVRSLDAGQFEGSPYLVMDYLEGVSLSSLSRLWGRLTVADACEIGRQMAEGLQVLADHKLVHRDLKPSNVMLVTNNLATSDEPVESGPSIKILDFGVARWRESSGITQAVTMPSFVVGTLEYMAPEQVEASSWWKGRRHHRHARESPSAFASRQIRIEDRESRQAGAETQHQRSHDPPWHDRDCSCQVASRQSSSARDHVRSPPIEGSSLRCSRDCFSSR